MTSSDRDDFFLDIVRDVSCELGFASLTRKMLANLGALASAESVSVYMLDASGTGTTYAAGDGRRPRLVVRSYDGREGLSDDDRYSVTTEDSSTLKAPWGYGLVGYVAETRIVVRLAGNTPRTVSRSVQSNIHLYSS